jgi:hypothetical protein
VVAIGSATIQLGTLSGQGTLRAVAVQSVQSATIPLSTLQGEGDLYGDVVVDSISTVLEATSRFEAEATLQDVTVSITGAGETIVSLSTLSGQGTLRTPTVLGVESATVYPATLQGEGNLYGTIVGTDITLENSDPLSGEATLQDVTVATTGGSVVQLSTLSGQGTLQTPTVSAITSVTVQLSTLSGQGTQQAPAVAAVWNETITLSRLEIIGGLQTPTVSAAESVVVTLSTLSGLGLLWTPTQVTAGGTTRIYPATLLGRATLQTLAYAGGGADRRGYRRLIRKTIAGGRHGS